MFGIGMPELIVILIICLLVFGAAKLPEVARNLGKGIKAFKKEMKDPKAITMKNGRPATQGVCPTCGTKMFRIGKA